MFRRTSTTPEATVAELVAAHPGDPVTVDVREPYEYAAGHVPGSVNIPLGQLGTEVGSLRAAGGAGTVFVICATGNRSKAAAGLLVSNGLDARSVAGGTAEWARAGHPVVTGASRR